MDKAGKGWGSYVGLRREMGSHAFARLATEHAFPGGRPLPRRGGYGHLLAKQGDGEEIQKSIQNKAVLVFLFGKTRTLDNRPA